VDADAEALYLVRRKALEPDFAELRDDVNPDNVGIAVPRRRANAEARAFEPVIEECGDSLTSGPVLTGALGAEAAELAEHLATCAPADAATDSAAL